MKNETTISPAETDGGVAGGGPVDAGVKSNDGLIGLGDIRVGDRLAAGKLKTALANAKHEGWNKWIKSEADEHALLAGCHFDLHQALRACYYFEGHLIMAEDRWAGQPFKLMDWQKYDVLMPMYGWLWPDGTRRFRTNYIEVAKKNGKSGLCSGIAIKSVEDDGIHGATVYCAGNDYKQARIVWEGARDMVQYSPYFEGRLEVKDSTSHIVNYRYNSNLVPLSADSPHSKEGLKPYALIFDELHSYKNRKLWNVFKYSTRNREQWLIVIITTAGVYDKTSTYWEQHEKALRILDGEIFDDRFLAYVTHVDYEKAANHDMEYLGKPETWHLANPSLGVILNEGDFADDFKEAAANPSLWNTFLRYRMNVPTEQAVRWIMMDKWDACGGPIDLQSLNGRECYGGLDMSSTEDITAFVLVFPREADVAEELMGEDIADLSNTVYEGIEEDEKDENGDPILRPPSRLLYEYDVLVYCWVPSENAQKRQEKDHVPYIEWAKRGFIELTSGDKIDDNRIASVIKRAYELYDIREIAYDPWNAAHMATELENYGITMVEFRQILSKMAGPTAYTEVLVNRRKLHHGDHPALRWAASNVQVYVDPNNNKRPVKDKSKEKIDPMVALIMGIGRAMLHENTTMSIYETEDIMAI